MKLLNRGPLALTHRDTGPDVSTVEAVSRALEGIRPGLTAAESGYFPIWLASLSPAGILRVARLPATVAQAELRHSMRRAGRRP